MRYLWLVFLLPCSAFAAEGDPSIIEGIYNTIVGFPDFIEKVFAYLIEFTIYLKFYFYLQSVEFAYGVAQQLSANMGVFELINSALAGLAPEQAAVLETFGFREGFTIIINALTTRFVLNFMGF